jgi:hypothetical protein
MKGETTVTDENKKLQPQSEELEIIELDDRMDMTIDPLVGFNVPTNGNCGNSGCC